MLFFKFVSQSLSNITSFCINTQPDHIPISIKKTVCDLWDNMPDEITYVYRDVNELIEYASLINNDTGEEITCIDINKTFEELGCSPTTSYTVCITPGEK